MKKVIRMFFKKNQIKIILACVSVFFLLVVFGTYMWFTIDGKIILGDDLSKSDWLLFWGSFLGFFGTCILGGLSIWQNYKLHEVNQRLTEQNTISNFYSQLNPTVIKVRKEIINNSSKIFGKTASQKLMRLEPKNDTLDLIIGTKQVVLIFESITNHHPINFFVENFRIGSSNGFSLVETFFWGVPATKDDTNYCFGITNDNKNIALSVNFEIHQSEIPFFEKIKGTDQIEIYLNFSYINPFKVKAYTNLLIRGNKSNINSDWIEFSITKTLIHSLSYQYQKE